MSELKNKISCIFSQNGISINEKQASQFEIYLLFLLEYNEKVNLTAVTDEDEVILKHFVDSCMGAGLIKKNAFCADIGTGAGFPGVPLAILREDITVLLVDALNKRLVFLNELKEKLGLKNVTTLHSRSEDAGQNVNYRQKFDYVFSRAVARMNVLIEYDLPFVKSGGSMLAWKGPQVIEELEEAKNAINILGGKLEKVHKQSVQGADHYIAEIKKIKDTPNKYPRQAGLIKKKPL
ncbi:MAG: 16S rRNA (guanine(527)-N(7))-methyltransferase RsmG [Clostridiales bacterium]|nr:16S rRNA (guanine(527)-N(7))-methyltransferase RsmG [Clostridiales bacterium]